jgi:malonyl-CoA/methylmalonyl-CoA synthetase
MNGSSLVTKNLTNNMRLFISGSAPLSSIDHQMFYQKTGHTILERYGMTETNMNTSNPYLGKRKPGSVGLPLPQVHIRIIDDNSKKQMGINEIGMIQIKGPNVFNSYWNNDQANQEAFSDDGFFITGDLGYIDEDGYITISGREKDLIISGGFNIYPKEIEDLINDYEEVIESAVIGKNDTDLGEVPVAIIVIGSKLREKIITELNKRFIKNLAKYKIPKEIKIINELPRNAMGKIQKNKIFDLIS